jgi:hypothetical protein
MCNLFRRRCGQQADDGMAGWVALVIGLARGRWYWPLVAAAADMAFTSYMLCVGYGWRIAAAVGCDARFYTHQILVRLLACYAAYGVGLGIRWGVEKISQRFRRP